MNVFLGYTENANRKREGGYVGERGIRSTIPTEKREKGGHKKSTKGLSLPLSLRQGGRR